MKGIFNKSLAIFLSLVIIISGLIFSVEASEITEENNPYGLTEKIEDGAILHAWCWSFDTIKENLPRIAEAGFTSVQTSPINKCLVGDDGGMELMGNGKWYYHYQPIMYTIGNYQLGTLEQFKSMCAEAEKYGIHIIVDAVVNHCTGTTEAIDDEIKNIEGGAFHENTEINDYENRYQCTQGWLLELSDLNTQNPNIQQMVLNYLKSCVEAGADGFRYDAAKHIELPDEVPENGQDFSSDFWPVVLNNGAEFQYGEVLQSNGSRSSDYSKYMSVTASNYGNILLEAMKNNNFNAEYLKSYCCNDIEDNKLVTWVESHDNYTGNYTGAQFDNEDIRHAWAVISARGETTPLFFSRPDGSSKSNIWGKNKIGIAGDDNFCHPEVAAVNKFRNALVGLPAKLSNPTDSNSLLMIERSNAGAVIINASDEDITLNCDTDVVDGTYTDQANGGIFTVNDGKLNGTVKAGAIAVIFNQDIASKPYLTSSKETNSSFRDTLSVTLNAYHSTVSTYSINGSAPLSFVSGDTITIGENINAGESLTLTLYGKNGDAETTNTYIYTKHSSPCLEGETVVYFDNLNYGWDNVYVFIYGTDKNNENLLNGDWPGAKMSNLGDGLYGYKIDESWDFDSLHLLFSNGNGTQYPLSIGYVINKGDSKIFNGNGLDDYVGTSTPISIPSFATIYFDNTNYNWSNVNLYVYSLTADGTGVNTNNAWPGLAMTSCGNNIYKYVIDDNLESDKAYVIFNNGIGTQYPVGEGYIVTKGDSKIFNGQGLDDYNTDPPVIIDPVFTGIYGDADMNGKVDIKDVTTIQKYIAEIISEDKIDLMAACVTGNETVGINDATYIQKYIAELISVFPVEDEPETVKITFNVKLPRVISNGDSIGIGANINGWNPADEDWQMTKIDSLNYQLVKNVDKKYLNTVIQYKYTIQNAQQENMWEQVEGTSTGSVIENRTYSLSNWDNEIYDTIAGFESDVSNTVVGGALDIFTLDMPQYSDGRSKKIRVWLPDGYDPDDTSKKYPVLYMHDGQNLFDINTSFVGEWYVDESITNMISNGYEGAIVVGIDNSADRFNEYTPDWDGADAEYSDNPSGEKYAAFIVDTLMPYINSQYNVRTDKDSTTIGGSSMGGLISYYISLKYPDVFGNALVFSPAYWVFDDDTILSEIEKYDFTNPDNMPKMYLYAGGNGDEAQYTRYIAMVSEKMISCGYSSDKINTLTDITQQHNESAWAKYFPQAYKWLVGFNTNIL